MPRAQASCTALETPVKDAESWIRSSQQWLDKETFEASTEYIKKGIKRERTQRATCLGPHWVLKAERNEEFYLQMIRGLNVSFSMWWMVFCSSYWQPKSSVWTTVRVLREQPEGGLEALVAAPCLLPFIGKAIFSVLRSAWKKFPFKSTKTLFQGTL